MVLFFEWEEEDWEIELRYLFLLFRYLFFQLNLKQIGGYIILEFREEVRVEKKNWKYYEYRGYLILWGQMSLQRKLE